MAPLGEFWWQRDPALTVHLMSLSRVILVPFLGREGMLDQRQSWFYTSAHNIRDSTRLDAKKPHCSVLVSAELIHLFGSAVQVQSTQR